MHNGAHDADAKSTSGATTLVRIFVGARTDALVKLSGPADAERGGPAEANAPPLPRPLRGFGGGKGGVISPGMPGPEIGVPLPDMEADIMP
jgi:hypothetical protein